jgi:hypothetical protein
MSAKAQSLPVAVHPHIRVWQFLAVIVLLAVAATLALTLGNGSGRINPGPDKGVGRQVTSSTTQVVGGHSSFQYHPLP